MTACGDESRRGQAAVADSDLRHLLAEWEPRARINEVRSRKTRCMGPAADRGQSGRTSTRPRTLLRAFHRVVGVTG